MKPQTRKFKVETNDLLKAVETAARARSSRRSVAVLGAVHLHVDGQKLTATATDMTTVIRTATPCRASGKAFTVIVMEPTNLVAALKTFEGTLQLEATTVPAEREGYELTIQSGNTKVTLDGWNPDDYPKLPLATSRLARITMGDFMGIWGHVKRAYSRDESRPVLTGLQTEIEQKNKKLRLVGTDSYRLARAAAPATAYRKTADFVVPGHTYELVARLFGKMSEETMMLVGEKDKFVSFTVGSTTVMGRTVEGQFPNWRQLLPDKFDGGTVTLLRAATLKAIQRIDKLSSRNAPVEVHLKPGELVKLLLRSAGKNLVEETLDLKPAVWEPMSIGLNPAFLVDVLSSFDTDTVDMKVISPLRPVWFESGDKDKGILLMPIRLADSYVPEKKEYPPPAPAKAAMSVGSF